MRAETLDRLAEHRVDDEERLGLGVEDGLEQARLHLLPAPGELRHLRRIVDWQSRVSQHALHLLEVHVLERLAGHLADHPAQPCAFGRVH